LFKAFAFVHPELDESDHLRVRAETYSYCVANKELLDISDEELRDFQKPGEMVGNMAITALSNNYKVAILVCYQLQSSLEQQMF